MLTRQEGTRPRWKGSHRLKMRERKRGHVCIGNPNGCVAHQAPKAGRKAKQWEAAVPGIHLQAAALIRPREIRKCSVYCREAVKP